MELTNEFNVAVPLDRAWAVLTDIEVIAPCMPGAELREVEGDEYRGVVKVKVGPITAQYRGKARFSELDEGGHRAVLRAEGRETRGQGSVTATIDASLVGEGEATRVSLVSDLAITGRVAQFGRGVLAEVTSKLLGEFVQCLEATVLSGAAGEAAPGPAGATPQAGEEALAGARPFEGGGAEPVDLLQVAGAPLAKRIAPLLAAAAMLLGWLVARRLRR